MKGSIRSLFRHSHLLLLPLTLSFFWIPQIWQDAARIRLSSPLHPILSAGAAVSRLFARARELLADRERMAAENRRLKEQLRELEARLAQEGEALRRAEEAVRAMGGIVRERRWQVVLAEVIGGDSSPWRRSLLIGKGSRAGIRRGMPVVWAENLIGRVVAVGPWCSRVMLITDPACRVAVRVSRSRATGILEGTGEACRMKYVARDQDVRVGDLVVTTGMDDAYPPGLAAGRCIHISEESGELFREVLVAPLASGERLEYTTVLLWTPPDRVLSEAER